MEIPKELSSGEGSDRLVKRRKALFFYRSIYLLWHEVRGGGILMIFVRKLDVWFACLTVMGSFRELHGVVENLHFRNKIWDIIYFNPEGPALNPVGTETDSIFWMPRRGYRS